MRIIQPLLNIIFHSRILDYTYVDEKSYKTILDIKEVLSVLEPIHDDETRMIWLEIPRGTALEWRNIDVELLGCKEVECGNLSSYEQRLSEMYPREVVWMYIHVSTYNGDTFLKISDGYSKLCILTKKDAHRESSPEDVSWITAPLLDLVKQRVSEISHSPEAYNSHVAEALPYRQRNGKIRCRDLYSIVKSMKPTITNKEKCIEVMKELLRQEGVYKQAMQMDAVPDDFFTKNNVVKPLDNMTIRRFCHYYHIADVHFRHIRNLAEDILRLEKLDDIEYYKSYGMNGNLDEYDLDSVSDYKRFAQDHYGELGLSRMNVNSENLYMKGKWLLYFSISYSAHIEIGMMIAMKLYESGVPLIYHDATTTLHFLEETGWIRISPLTYHDYLHGGDDVGVFPMPFIEECDTDNEISREQYNEIVAKTVWEPEAKIIIDKVIPIGNAIYDLIRSDVSEPLTVSGIRQLIEKKYKIYLFVGRKDAYKGYYYRLPYDYRPKDYVEDEQRYYASFNEAMTALILEFNDLCRHRTKNKSIL